MDSITSPRNQERIMHGCLDFPLSAQIADTIRVHGLSWAAKNAKKRGLPMWIFLILARQALRA